MVQAMITSQENANERPSMQGARMAMNARRPRGVGAENVQPNKGAGSSG